MPSNSDSASDQPSQADRRTQTRAALLSAAAQEFSRFGYAGADLERVANAISSPAGKGSSVGGSSARSPYSRPGLYELVENKEELAVAVVNWLVESWHDEVGFQLANEADPVGSLIVVARGTAVYSRSHEGQVLARFRDEFAGTDHPVGRAADLLVGGIVEAVVRIIAAGQRTGSIPPGTPAQVLAIAYMGTMAGVVHNIAGQAPHDVQLAERAALGVLGLLPTSGSGDE